MFIYRLLDINLIVITNQASIRDTHRRKEPKHNTIDSCQITKEENKRREEFFFLKKLKTELPYDQEVWSKYVKKTKTLI